MIGILMVTVGGGIGAALRYGCGLVVARHVDVGVSLWATLGVNVLGSLLMGVAVAWFAARGEAASQTAQLLVTTGILGGFTTYSAYAMETVRLVERGAWPAAAAYALGTMVLCIGVFFAGAALFSKAAA
ncbi:MAG: CrcB family protein [Pseudomonadota bacterium]